MNPRRLLGIGLFFVIASVLLSPSAGAHAEYLASDPDTNGILPDFPSSVAITFTESVAPGSSVIRVTNASGARFDRGSASLSGDGRTVTVFLASGGPGLYSVGWVVMSAVDGHPTSGSFEFAVQNPDGSVPDVPNSPTGSERPVSPIEIVFRFLGFTGLAVALGAAVLAALIWIPAGRDPDARESPAYGAGLRTILHWGRVGAFAFGVGMVGLWFQLQGIDSTLSTAALFGSPFLLSVLGRGSLAVALFFLLSAAFARSSAPDPSGVERRLRLSLVLALAAIGVGSMGTHAAARGPLGPLGIAADAAHVFGAALWVGGLACVVAVRSFLRDPAGTSLARHVYARFSRLAGYAVGLVLGGGVVLALLLVGSWEALVGTPYGWVVLAKIGLFAPMVAVGAYNRYRVLPAIAEARDASTSVRALTRNVRSEVSLGAAVLALAALLAALVPSVSVLGPSSPFPIRATAEGLRIDFYVSPVPTVPGNYTFTILVYNATNGEPYNDALTGSGTLTFHRADSPTNLTENLSGPHDNHFFVTSSALSQPGVWRIDARFLRGDGAEVLATFHLTIGGSG